MHYATTTTVAMGNGKKDAHKRETVNRKLYARAAPQME